MKRIALAVVLVVSLAAPAFGTAERDDKSGGGAKMTGADSVVAQGTDCFRRHRWQPKLRAQKCGVDADKAERLLRNLARRIEQVEPGPSIQHPMTNVSFQSKYLFGRKGETKVYARLSEPAGQGPHPAVVLLHTCGGFGPHVYRDWPDFLTGLGYVVLSVDSYGARGARNCAELKRVWHHGRGHNEARRIATVIDAYGALDYLAKLPFVDGNRVAVVGFSAGAGAINIRLVPQLVPQRLRSSGELDFKAAISFYTRCYDLFGYTKDHIPLIQIIGDKDSDAPACKQVGQRTPMEVHILPGVYHAFDSGQGRGIQYSKDGVSTTGGRPSLYDHDAVMKSRELVKAFLAKHLEPEAVVQLVPAGDQFDGEWQGLMSCGSCENCLGPLKKDVNIKIESGRFKLKPDATYKGKGIINDQGNVRIRSRKNFWFDGTYDGKSFTLTGERGSRTCTIELSRATSPVEASK